MCSGSEAGSYLRRIDLVYHSTLGLSAMKKKDLARMRQDRLGSQLEVQYQSCACPLSVDILKRAEAIILSYTCHIRSDYGLGFHERKMIMALALMRGKGP